MDKYSDGNYQDAVSQFVGREVIYCVSSLVWELRDKFEAHPDYESEIIEAYQSGPDYSEPAYHHAQGAGRDDLKEYLEGSRGMAVYDDESFKELLEVFDDEDEAREYCDYHGIDPDYDEIYEHWIVSGFLARKLAEKGEKIIEDFFGLTLWGRTTTGQAICIDRVICDIYDDVMGAE